MGTVPVTCVEICYVAKYSPYLVRRAINTVRVVVADPWQDLVRLDRKRQKLDDAINKFHLAHSSRRSAYFWVRVQWRLLLKRQKFAEIHLLEFVRVFLSRSVKIGTVLMQKGDVWVEPPPGQLLEILERPIRWISVSKPTIRE